MRCTRPQATWIKTATRTSPFIPSCLVVIVFVIKENPKGAHLCLKVQDSVRAPLLVTLQSGFPVPISLG